MHKKILIGGVLAICAISASPVLAVNLLVNGSFEQNNFFTERAGFPRLDDVNGSSPTGWTRDSADKAEYFTSAPLYQGVTIYNAADGNFFIGSHDGESWHQTFATTAGQTYQLTYSSAYGAAWWADNSAYYRPGSLPGTVSLVGNSLLLSTDLDGSAAAPTGNTLLDSPFVWTTHSVQFTADSNLTTLTFAGPSQFFGGFVFVDNVSVEAVTAQVPHIDTFQLKSQYKQWCKANPKLFETHNTKVTDGITLTFTRDLNGDTDLSDVRIKINNTGSIDFDAFTLKGLAVPSNKSGSKLDFDVSGVNPGNKAHFFTIRGQASVDKLGNVTKVTGTWTALYTSRYMVDKKTGQLSDETECFGSGTLGTGKKLP